MENTNENMKSNKNSYTNEELKELKLLKYGIISLIALILILVFFSTFFIHDIIDMGTLNISQPGNIINPNPNNNNNNNNNQGNNNEDNNNTNNSNNQPEDNKPNPKPKPPIVIEERFTVLEDSTDWDALKELNIFNTNSQCVKEGKIAPGISGLYYYTVENYRENAMKYDMKYTEQNQYSINMVYRLKRNGQYVAGNDSTWVKANLIDLSNLHINGKTSDIFMLEWKWEDAENDTQIGETDGANYKLFINVDAEEDV